MSTKPYTPCPIEGYKVSLTKRQELAQVRKALTDAKEAKRYWPDADWTALLADLERQEASLAADIKRTDDAIYGKAMLRPEFVNCKNGLTAKLIVHPPNDKVDMPFLSEVSWSAAKRILCSEDGDDIEVNADYDVYICHGDTFPVGIIPRYE